MMALSVPAHKQTNPAKRPGQIVNPIQGIHGHFPMGPMSGTVTGRHRSCEGSIESNDPKPAALITRPRPVFAASLDDEVTD